MELRRFSMQLKQIAIALALLTISGCSLLQQPPREVKIITKPIQIEIVQPVLPRALKLKEPRWYVVSDAKVIENCLKNEEGKSDCKLGKENLYPEGYTHLDKFIDSIKKKHGGDTVFVAMSVADYELMAYNTQEIKRYINQLGEVIVYYRDVTIKVEKDDVKEQNEE
jgi:hypothetical protein|tara:strand:- start:210 stop:710 length:501 start_codon:yes stop_codon:yes gene_type:complete